MSSPSHLQRSRFPYSDPLSVVGTTIPASEVIRLLEPYVTDQRRRRIAEVIAERTYSIATVVEGLYDLGNVSAVMRTAEGLGFQPFHVVHSGDAFRTSTRTTQGADKWLDLHRWSTPGSCVRYLKDRGYRVVATHLEAAVPITEIDFTEPTAMVFGNEANGVSDEMLAAADVRCIIPMVGFVQSFNISVAAAVALYHAHEYRIRRLGGSGDLSPEERRILAARFTLRSVKRHADILRRLISE